MKNFLYFIVGIIYLPIWMATEIIVYIRDLGMKVIDGYKFCKRMATEIIVYLRYLGKGVIDDCTNFGKKG